MKLESANEIAVSGRSASCSGVSAGLGKNFREGEKTETRGLVRSAEDLTLGEGMNCGGIMRRDRVSAAALATPHGLASVTGQRRAWRKTSGTRLSDQRGQCVQAGFRLAQDPASHGNYLTLCILIAYQLLQGGGGLWCIGRRWDDRALGRQHLFNGPD